MQKPTKHPVGHFTINGEHPALEGHFPGNPVVPGAVLLDHAMSHLVNAHGRSAVSFSIPRVKFLRPVLPGQVVRVSSERSAQQLDFVCEVDGRVVIEGRFEPDS